MLALPELSPRNPFHRLRREARRRHSKINLLSFLMLSPTCHHRWFVQLRVQSIPESTFLREALLSTIDSCRRIHKREHCKKENSPSGGSGMTHASHSSPMGNQAQDLHVTQMSCNQYQNRLSCGRRCSRQSAEAAVEYTREYTVRGRTHPPGALG